MVVSGHLLSSSLGVFATSCGSCGCLGLDRLTARSRAAASSRLAEIDSAIAAVYDRLWDRDPPAGTRLERQAAREIAERAARGGWAPPMAWDDDLIDLPNTRPADGWRPRRRQNMRAVDIVEDAEFVREAGGYRQAGRAAVARRLGINRDRLDQAYLRARRYAARDAASRASADAEPEAEAG